MQRSRSRGRLKAPNIPVFVENSESSSEPRQLAGVLDTIDRIRATSKDIIQAGRGRDEGRLFASTLDIVSALSRSLWEEILLLLPPAWPTLQTSLRVYEIILFDIQQILNLDDPPKISDDRIDRRLDDFMLQFQEALDRVEGTISQRSPPGSTHFFPYAHHFLVAGGNFTSNPVLHDPVVRAQSENILQEVIYIKRGVLFA
jgi:hypothetical protein